MSPQLTKLGFANTYLYPALALFLIPVLSLLFFRHVEANTYLSSGFYASSVQWAIFLSWFCIAAGVAAFVLTGICVICSLQSQSAQYYSLLFGWHVLRSFCTFEVVAQGLLLFALTFWIPAYLFEGYSVKLLVFMGVACGGAAIAVLMSIFQKIEDDFVIDGKVISRKRAPKLWEDLERLSEKMGTAPPDQVIAGIDDNFFVTQTPVVVREQGDKPRTYTGRTLFVSLSLLKRLPGREADAVVLHELAHFSGNDTLYSQKTAPLLMRYGHYLEALHGGVISRPVFYFAVLFRALFEISLGKQSRQREFRADRLAAKHTSPQDMAHALLRITAYSQFRGELEQEFFDAEEQHEAINLSERIEGGFTKFASAFIDSGNVGKLTTVHPFDSHPPLEKRLRALRYNAKKDAVRAVLCDDSPGPWYKKILGAEKLEREQWSAYEEEFRQYHLEMLAYRYLPSTEKEQEHVESYFPAKQLKGLNDKPVYLDFEKVVYGDWDRPIYFHEVKSMAQHENRIIITIHRNGKDKPLNLYFNANEQDQQVLLLSLESYYGRAAAAIAYQERLAEAAG